MNEAAFTLRALGRLTEALEPMRAGIEDAIKLEDWNNAARYSSNLSELELTLGAVAEAVADAERSVTYADRSDDAFQRMSKRATHADALHQASRGLSFPPKSAAGSRSHAESLFCEAEQMQAESQPDYPLLYSLQGFRYCDLLLAPAERAAWQLTLECGNSFPLCLPSSRVTSDGFSSAISKPRGKESGDESPHSKTIRAVSQRATQTLKWMTDGKLGLLDIALDHLTLGRAALYESLLSDSPISNLKSEIEQSVSGLRRAGQLDDFPRGLLTRAWFRFLSGERTGPDSAQSDLDEAWEIAVRGPMRQHMADVLLSRARLFGMTKDEIPNDERMTNTEGRMKQYPWDSPAADLAAAEKLINDCGYHRRDEELADAKAAMFRR